MTTAHASAPERFTAAVAEKFGPTVDVKLVDLPTPGHNQALVKVLATGVCHSDLHAIEGDWPVKPVLPLIPGHEGVGEVVALGPGEHNDIEVGSRVGSVVLWEACGTCEQCRTGRENYCPTAKLGGYTVPGSFGEYMLVDTRYCARVPADADPAEIAPILCAGVTVYKGLKETGVRPGQFMVISGVGGLGHIAVQYAVAMGMRVIAIDIADDKLELARRHGAEFTVNARDTDPGAAVVEYTGGGSHGVLVTAVHEQAFGQAIHMARTGGTIVFNGLPPGEFPAPIFDIVFKGLTIRGSLLGTRQDLAEAIDFYSRGKVRPTVTECAIEEVNQALEDLRRGRVDGRMAIRFAAAD
ncbi:zinc-dependent alcohol dehydrogenase [Corynebacterium sp. 13CS0277]|uniref:zinc-dependent alcohol dehydrogenase n=1 Tax=Corynebacterium sp. 13CS0277 TaxID=2071994 RepID=UPI000D039A06|nr:zinc-dependent alcohol dehydrogenase [Corynebacterium sp. 13CS0277]PRQ11415.1 zinc-dependent alcohol dehydrogenase [Corynebacterium sp. 13CS0277]